MIKHFIDLDNFNKSELKKILSLAFKIKNNQKKYSNIFADKLLVVIMK